MYTEKQKKSSHINLFQYKNSILHSFFLPFNVESYNISNFLLHILSFRSSIFKTGIQYLPVDSKQMSLQLYFTSQSHSSCNPFVKEEKRACLYSVRPLESVMPMQAKIHVLWTSSPQQFLRRCRVKMNIVMVTSFRNVADYWANRYFILVISPQKDRKLTKPFDKYKITYDNWMELK